MSIFDDEIPSGANPGWNMMTVNLYDKAQRGCGFNFKEAAEFRDICSMHIEQLIHCYSCFDKEMTKAELIARCIGCPYANTQDSEARTRRIYTNKHPFFIENIVDIEWDDPKYYVYLISDGKYIKIGITKDLQTRLRELQVANPNQLELICAIPLKSEKDARDLEERLHHEYDEFYIRGEWFDILKHIDIQEFSCYFGKERSRQ